jgi:flavin reductase (DIM6/NTAB) family NADH-FMN oxidoreductase RutF
LPARSAGSNAVCKTELLAGTHTLFVGEVLRVELGEDAPPLLRSRSEYL